MGSNTFRSWGFADALDPSSRSELEALTKRMHAFYTDPANAIYWEQADAGNERWLPETHPYHCDLRSRMTTGERVVDFGCGGTHAFSNLKLAEVLYTGLDWSTDQVAQNRSREPEATYIAGSVMDGAREIDGSADWAISLFAIEHCTFPDRMLRRMAEAVRPGGRVAILCPDFEPGMPSLRAGFTAATRRDKFRRLQWLDLAWGIVQDKVFWPRRLRAVHRSSMRLPIYLHPRCLDAPYYSDTDAVFLATEAKIADHLQSLGLEVTTRGRRLDLPHAANLGICYVIAEKA